MKIILKIIYNFLPFKKILFLFIKKFVNLPHKIYQHLHFKGSFDVIFHGKKLFKLFHHGFEEENEIFWNDLDAGYERKSIQIWLQLCKKRRFILDVGANTGLYGIAAKAINPSSHVHCFEPLPGVLKYLQQNIELNQYAIKIHSYALSDYTGKGVVYLREGQNFTYTVTVNKNTVSPNFKVQKIDIDVMRIDKLIEEKVIQIPDLIKLDVERYEYEVLCGMGKYLKEFYPDLIVEVLDAQQACRLNQIFVGTEYIFFNIDDINQSIRQTKTIEPSVHGNNLICTLKTAINLTLIEKINTFSD